MHLRNPNEETQYKKNKHKSDDDDDGDDSEALKMIETLKLKDRKWNTASYTTVALNFSFISGALASNPPKWFVRIMNACTQWKRTNQWN